MDDPMDEISTGTPSLEIQTNNLATEERIVIPTVVLDSPSMGTFDELVKIHATLDEKTEAQLTIAPMMDLLASMISMQSELDQVRWKRRFNERIDVMVKQRKAGGSMEKGE